MEIETGSVTSEDEVKAADMANPGNNEPTPAEQPAEPAEPSAQEPPAEAPAEPAGAEEPAEPEAPAEPESIDVTPDPPQQSDESVSKLRSQVEYMQRQMERQKNKPATPLPDPIDDKDAPKIEDFNTIGEFEAAEFDFKVTKQVNDQVRKALQQQPELEVEQEREEFKTNLFQTGPKLYPDFTEVVENAQNPFTVDMIDAVRAGDTDGVNPADVFYHLGKNNVEAVRLSRLGPVQMAREIVKIEGRLAKAKSAAPKIKTVSDAPDPITPTDAAIIVTKDPAKMSQREYEKWRSEGGGT